jgi:hypothetical protein
MTKHRAALQATLTAFGLILALLWLPTPGTTDVPIFIRWAAATSSGVRDSYASFFSYGYPPLGFVFLRGAVWIAAAVNGDLFIGYKVSLLLALVLTGGLFWLWTRNFYLSLGLFLALLPNSMAYGYTDIYFAVLLVGALWALYKNRLALFTVLYCGACLVKWQPLILAPFLAIYLARAPGGGDWQQTVKRIALRVALPAAVIALGTLAIFGKPVVEALAGGLTNSFLSGQALNLNWMVTFGIRALDPKWFGGISNGLIVPIDTPDWHVLLWSKILFWLLFGPACLAFALSQKSFDDLIRFGLCGYLTYFMLNTGVHENHLFLAAILAGVLAWRQREHLSTFALWALAANINLFVFYGADGSGWAYRPLAGVDMTLLLAAAFVAIFAVFYLEWVVVPLRQWRDARQPAPAAEQLVAHPLPH